MLAGFAIVVSILLILIILSGVVRYIPNNRAGIVEKLVSGRGSVRTGFIALGGEAGFQPDVLRGGWHLFFPFQYRIHMVPLVTIPQGRIGYVFARDGEALSPSQTLASNAKASDFQDAAAFLRGGGQRGPQRRILREGTYAINLAQFAILTDGTLYYVSLNKGDDVLFKDMALQIGERGGFEPVILQGSDDLVGIVTVHDGPSLGQDDIIAPLVGDDPALPETFHNKFQEAERFLQAGGRRGRQLQVLVEGSYYINRLFATVETVPKTVIEVGSVGVVVSYTGETGVDLSGADYSHGEMVSMGKRGVWSTPLLPGKYAFNTFAGKVVAVPTTNVILKWIRGAVGSHRYDENLAEISLITRDAFEPLLPVSVVMHIDYRKAPLVIQRFGDIKRLVEQTLDPLVSAYFKDVGQTRTLIELIQERNEIQKVASEQMRENFGRYNLELAEVLIGTPTSPEGDQQIEKILTQLRSRQIAQEQVATYNEQQTAAVKERELREAEARALQQQQLTESEIGIAIQSNEGKADYQRSVQQAAQIRALAEAEAEKAARIGIGQAIAAEEQVRAYGGPQYQIMQQVMGRFAEAIEKAGVDVVPKIVISGAGGATGGGGGSGLLDALLGILLSDRLGIPMAQTASRDPQVEALRNQIRDSLAESLKQPAAAPPPKPAV